MELTSRFRRCTWLLLAGLLTVALVAAACGDDDDDDNGDEPTGAATEAGDDPTEEPGDDSPTEEPSDEPAAAYPVEVTDLLGRDVTIDEFPEAIVALSPTAAEFIYAVGEGHHVVGRTTTTDFPPEIVDSATDIGPAYQPAFEAILQLEPDLIVADSVIHAAPNYRDPLEALDVPVLFAGANNHDEVLAGIALMGEALDVGKAAEEAAAEIEDALADAQAALADVSVTAVALIVDQDQVLYAAKADSFAGDIFAQLGIENVAASQPDSGPFPGYAALPLEVMLQLDPDYIFTITPAPEPAPRLSTIIPTIPPFAGLNAVQQGNVIELDLQTFLQAQGPRIEDAFTTLAEILAPAE